MDGFAVHAFKWKLSAGVGLYWLASAFVGVVQAGVLRREQRRMTAAAA